MAADSPSTPRTRPRVAVSACLLGERTRYDGDHRRDRFIAEELGRLFEWVPICPEVELGLGIPRETLQLEGDAQSPRLRATRTRRDLTREMNGLISRRIRELIELGACGFLLKRGSPSCGLERVKLYPPAESEEPAGGDRPGRTRGVEPALLGTGLLARAVRNLDPPRPAADEEMLRDPAYAARFVREVFDFWRRGSFPEGSRG